MFSLMSNFQRTLKALFPSTLKPNLYSNRDVNETKRRLKRRVCNFLLLYGTGKIVNYNYSFCRASFHKSNSTNRKPLPNPDSQS